MRRGSLADERPDLLSEWSSSNEISPSEVSCGSHKKVQWRCSKGHEWQATVKNRALIGSGCPYCSCRAVLKGFNDLASIHPELVEEWSDRNLPLSPTEVSEFSNKKVWWKCKFGHRWQSTPNNRINGRGCPVCSGRLVMAGVNDLATKNPELALEWDYVKNYPLTPCDVTSGKNIKAWCHGHIHSNSDYYIGETNILCNPYGYANYESRVKPSKYKGKEFILT